MRHRRWLNPRVPGLLDSIDHLINEWPQRFNRKGHQFRENASLLAMSEFERAADFCRCCTIGSSRGKYAFGTCKVWKLCPYCSHLKRKKILSKFLPVFRRGRWWFLTVSPTELCPLNICSVECLVAWWDACRFALASLIKTDLIKGAFMFETMSVHRYWPHVEALPHVHAIILADNMTPTIINDLKRLVANYHGQSWNTKKKRWIEPDVPEPIWASASTRTYPIRHDYDFAAILCYLCNPINLAKAYKQDWPQVVGKWRESCLFNENAIDAINAWCGAIENRWGHRYLGALQHAHRDFTGIKKATREKKSHSRLVKLMLEDCQLKRIAEFDPDSLGTPVEFEDDDLESH